MKKSPRSFKTPMIGFFSRFRNDGTITEVLLALIMMLCLGRLSATAAPHLITLDETNNTANLPVAFGGVVPGNVWLVEPGTPVGPTGTMSDLAHFFNVAGLDKVIFISDQDSTNPFDDPADRLGFGGNIPAVGDIFLVEKPLGILGLDEGADWTPGPGQPGYGDDPLGQPYKYTFISNCSCEVPEPSTALLLCSGLFGILGIRRKERAVATRL